MIEKQGTFGFEIPKNSPNFEIVFDVFENGHGPEGFMLQPKNGDSQSHRFCETFAASIAGNLPSVFLIPDRGLLLVNHMYSPTLGSSISPAVFNVGITRRQYDQLVEMDKRKGKILIDLRIHSSSLPTCRICFFQ